MASVEHVGSAVGEAVPPANEHALRMRMRGLYAAVYGVFVARTGIQPLPGVSYQGQNFERGNDMRYRLSNTKTETAGIGRLYKGGMDMSRMVAEVTPMPKGIEPLDAFRIGELALHIRRDPKDGSSLHTTRLRGLLTDSDGQSPRTVRITQGELWKYALTNVGKWEPPHELLDGDAFLEAEGDLTQRIARAHEIIEGTKPIKVGMVDLVDPVTGETLGREPYL